MHVHAYQIVKLLRAKHVNDVAYSEVKNGPTQSAEAGELKKLDFWAMVPTWSPPTAIGYEIKVSRSDFLRDEKWRGYLPYCNRFYFVAPAGVIKPEEVPEEAGLLLTTTNVTGLLTKKKAPHRNVQIPDPFWRYLFMSKVKKPATTKERWTEILEGRQADYAIGRANSERLRKQIEARIDAVREENVELLNRMSRYETVRATLETMGFDPDRPPDRWGMEAKIEAFQELFPKQLKRKIKDAARDLEDLMREIDRRENGLLTPSQSAISADEFEDGE